MIDYTYKICSQCDRINSCLYPCQEYADYYREQYKAQEAENIRKSIHVLKVNRLTDEKKKELKELMGNCSGNVSLSQMSVGSYDDNLRSDFDIDDLFECSVDDQLWVNVINRRISYTEIIDKNALLGYLEEKNEKYCEDNGLCTVCRARLVEKVEMEEIWGSVQESEKIWCCPNHC